MQLLNDEKYDLVNIVEGKIYLHTYMNIYIHICISVYIESAFCDVKY